jgi:hypothetical protein
MRNPQKILVALVVLFALGATMPVFAQPVGTWEGTGEGWCPFPVPYPSEYMKPWQTWKGRLEPNPQQVGYIFYGDWYDADHNHGSFKGRAILETPTEIYFEGDWYWWDERFMPPRVYRMGPFNMTFRRDGSSCRGEWQAHLPSGIYSGTMRGRWIEP